MPLPARRAADDSSHDLTAVVATLTHRLGELGNTIESLRGMVMVNREYTQGLKSLVPTIYGVDRAAHMFRRAIENMTRAMNKAAGAMTPSYGVSGAAHSAAQAAVGPLNMLASAIDRMVGAASPDVWSTLTGSLQLIAATIGTMLMPYIIGFIIGLQQLYHWLRGLSPETKSLIAKIVLLGVALAGLAVALPPIIAAGRMLIGTLSLLTAGFSAFGITLMAVLVLVTAAVLELEAKAKNMNKAMEDQQKKNNDAVGGARNSESYKKAMELPPEQRGAFMDEQVKAAQERKKKAWEELQAAKREQDAARMDNTWGWGDAQKREDAALVRRREAEKKFNQAETDLAREHSARTNVKDDTFGKPGPGGGQGQQGFGETLKRAANEGIFGKTGGALVSVGDVIGKAAARGGKPDPKAALGPLDKMQEMLLSLQTQGQPSFGMIDDVYRKIQVSALKDNTLELEMKKIWTEQRDLLLQQLSQQQKIADNTGKQVVGP